MVTPEDMGNKLKKVYCEETTPQSTCASSVLFGFILESMETYDEKTPAEIRRERDKKRYAAMSASDKQAKIIKNRVRRTINRVNKKEQYKEMLPNRCSQTCDAEVSKRPTTRSATQGVYGERQTFDVGIWEPDDETLAAQEEEDLDCKAPADCTLDSGVFEDDEARVYHPQEMQFKTFRDPEVVILENDPFGQVYKDLPAQHLVLKKVPICEFCGAIRFPG